MVRTASLALLSAVLWCAQAAAQPAAASQPGAPVPVAAAQPGPVARQVVWPAEKLPPFRLGLVFGHGFAPKDDLTFGPPTAIGFDFGIGSGEHVRTHLGVAHAWENADGKSRKGFRIDLIQVGFPIPVLLAATSIHIEPLLRVVRGEILFSTDGDGKVYFNVQSGFGVAATAAIEHWFVAFEPVSVDFRYFAATKDVSKTGFATLWWLQFTIGREF